MSAHAATLSSPPPDVLTILVRPVTENDWPYIKDSWRTTLALAHNVPQNRGWRSKISMRIDRLFERGATFLVACDPDDHTHILGWACFEKPLIHYVLVKHVYRGQGIARQLLSAFADQAIIYCSEWTSYVTAIHRTHTFLRKVLPC